MALILDHFGSTFEHKLGSNGPKTFPKSIKTQFPKRNPIRDPSGMPLDGPKRLPNTLEDQDEVTTKPQLSHSSPAFVPRTTPRRGRRGVLYYYIEGEYAVI